jgi:hypothetical protein
MVENKKDNKSFLLLNITLIISSLYFGCVIEQSETYERKRNYVVILLITIITLILINLSNKFKQQRNILLAKILNYFGFEMSVDKIVKPKDEIKEQVE